MTASTTTPTAADTSRPPLKPGLISAIAALVITGGVSAYAWLGLPADARIPVHVTPTGEVDGYAAKLPGLAMVPVYIIVVSAIMVIWPRITPRRKNLVSSARGYTAGWIGASGFLTVLHAAIVYSAFSLATTAEAASDAGISVVRAVAGGTGLLFVVMGNYLPKTRSNWSFGIRTPWTLDSERSWARTHRLAGHLFLWYGVTLAITAFLLDSFWLVTLMLSGAIAIAATITTYSWWTWRSGPEGA